MFKKVLIGYTPFYNLIHAKLSSFMLKRSENIKELLQKFP